MRRMAVILLTALLLPSAILVRPAMAVLPDEVLADPALEARARALSREIRCPVCQGENIDDSNAAISRDLRVVLRERLVAGDSDEEAVDYLVARYGEFILFKPRADGANLILWLAGPIMLILAGGVAILALRRRAIPEDHLSEEEEKRLREIMEK